jgi:hypothetical protein
MIHQRHVHHRHFVNDQEIALQRVAIVPGEGTRGGLDFEQPVDCLGLDACCVGQALGSPAGWRSQQAPDFLRR